MSLRLVFVIFVILSSLWVGTSRAQPVFNAAGTFVDSGSDGAGNATSLSIPAPGSLVADDLIIVQFQCYDNNGSTVISAPDDTWTLIRQDDESAVHTTLWWHLATGSGDGPWTFTADPGDYLAGQASSYSGENTTTPINVEAGNGSSATSVSVTPTVSGGLLVVFFAAQNVTFSSPAGLTQLYGGESPTSYWANYSGDVAAPNSGTASSTYTTSKTANTETIVVAAATATPTPTPTATATPTPTATPTVTPTATPTPGSPSKQISNFGGSAGGFGQNALGGDAGGPSASGLGGR